MKASFSILFAFVVFFSCQSGKDKLALDNSAGPSLSGDDLICYELKMEKWFSLFNQYQDAGYTMHEADARANEKVNKEFNDCLRLQEHKSSPDKRSARK